MPLSVPRLRIRKSCGVRMPASSTYRLHSAMRQNCGLVMKGRESSCSTETTSLSLSSLDLQRENALARYFSGTILYLLRMSLTLSRSWLKVSPLETSTSMRWNTQRSSTTRMLALVSHTSTTGSFSRVVSRRTSTPPQVLSSNCQASNETSLQSSFSRRSSRTRQLQCRQLGSASGQATGSSRVSLETGGGVSRAGEKKSSSHLLETRKTGTSGMEQQPSLLALPSRRSNSHRTLPLLAEAATGGAILPKYATYFSMSSEWARAGKARLNSLSSAWKLWPASLSATTRKRCSCCVLPSLLFSRAITCPSAREASSAAMQRLLFRLGIVRYPLKPCRRKRTCSWNSSAWQTCGLQRQLATSVILIPTTYQLQYQASHRRAAIADGGGGICWRGIKRCNSRQMHRQASKKQTSKHHERSLDDFVKNLKRYNLKSERYDRLHSPDPFGPYRNNTTHTLERSRTLSGKHSRKTNKTTRQRVERLLAGSSLSREKLRTTAPKPLSHPSLPSLPSKTGSAKTLPNPADLISVFSKRIRETEHFLEGRSKMGLLLCRRFLEMLNEIVENMVLNLQQNMEELEKTVLERVEKEIGERAEKRVAGMQRKMAKLERETLRLLEKENYNNNLIYHLRLTNLDVDREFGKCVFKSEAFGGSGYRDRAEEEQEQGGDPLQPFSSSELLYLHNERGESSGSEAVGLGEEWQWSSGRHRRREEL